jgi:cysteine-rich repeat protein
MQGDLTSGGKLMNSLRYIAAVMAVFLGATLTLADESSEQAQGTQKLMSDTRGEARIRVDSHSGNARFVHLPPRSMSASAIANRRAAPDARAMAFFREYGTVFGVTDANSELKAARTRGDASGAKHSIFRQRYKDLPVFGGELRAHFDSNGDMVAVNGNFVGRIKVDMTPRLSPDDAAGIAISRVERGDLAAINVEAPQQRADRREREYLQGSRSTKLSAVSNELMVFRAGLIQGIPGKDHLAYEVEVRDQSGSVREFVYVDAHNGKVIDQITGIYHAVNRQIYESNIGNLVWSEGDAFPTGNVDWDNEVDGAGETYNLFASMTGGAYVSYDGADASMLTVNNDPNINCPNANWNGTSTNYCTGVTGDDTVAHEWGHAYTEYTNNLIYQWQSGALNESYSDIWGEVVDFLNGRGTDAPGGLRSDANCSIFGNGAPSVDNTYRWLSGEDDPAFGGAIRDLWSPVCYGDPGKVTDNEYFCGTADSGGVHSNSGVPNHAFALMVDGGNYNGETITGIGLTKAAHIHWAAQNMLTPASNFLDQADALEAACTSLTGVNLAALSTSSTNAGSSGEIISAANCAAVAQIIAAVEFRTVPTQCDFQPLLQPDAPLLCEAQGSVQTIAFEDFEGGALPAGWTVSRHGVANPGTADTPDWDVVGSLPGGANGAFAAFVADLVIGDCAADDETAGLSLDSPAIVLPVGEVPHVAFDHWVATEFGWDGGNVKVSVNGGAYVLVTGGAYSFNPYNSALNSAAAGNTNPLGGEEAFTGTDAGKVGGSWGQSQVNLYGLAFPGDTIQLRFDFGVDGCNGAFGWYVDEVHTYSCSAELLPICGDGQQDPGEMCDDGNMNDGDGCSASCAVESGWLCSGPTAATGSINILADWSFEGGVPNADWAASSTFGGIQEFPLCGPGNGCPAAGLATTGVWNVWIGGLSAGVTSSVEQTVTIPATATDLTVQVLRGICDDPSDTVHVSLDGTDIGTVVCDATDGNFVEQTFSVAGYNDGGAHTLFIGGTVGGTNGTHSNIFVDDVTIENNVGTPAAPSMCARIVEDLSCNAGPVGFDDGIADAWTVVDNTGVGLLWTNIAGAGEPGNYTGGDGDAATVSSDAFGPADFDTDLRSNVFSLADATSASFEYSANYQNFAAFDLLDLDISIDGGGSWTNLSSWNEDHGSFRSTPGEVHAIDLTPYLGESDVQLRWRYYDPTNFDWDWYAQVDNIALACDLTGRMSGEGRVSDDEGVRYRHHFKLYCQDGATDNKIEIEWEGDDDDDRDRGRGNNKGKFKLTELTEALCSDRPGIDEGRPTAGFDTFIGAGTGELNGEPASITFRFTDAGEPGKGDEAEYTITGSNGVTVSGVLDKGNHQAHAGNRDDDDDD